MLLQQVLVQYQRQVHRHPKQGHAIQSVQKELAVWCKASPTPVVVEVLVVEAAW